jgi:hypothetical protein
MKERKACVLYLLISHEYYAVSFCCGINRHVLEPQWAEFLWDNDSHITVFYIVKAVPTLK